MTTVNKKTEIKSTLTIRGAKADRIRLLRHILGLNSDADILNHLIQRGMSAEAGTFATWEMSNKMMQQFGEQFGSLAEQMKIELQD